MPAAKTAKAAAPAASKPASKPKPRAPSPALSHRPASPKPPPNGNTKKPTAKKTNSSKNGKGTNRPSSAALAPAAAPAKSAKFAAPWPAPAAATASSSSDPHVDVDVELRCAEALLAKGDAEAALAIMARLEKAQAVAPAVAPATAPKQLKRAATMPAMNNPSIPTSLPRGGTLVKLTGLDALGMKDYNGRMGRVIEMNGRSFMEDGKTELCTVLLDSRSTDYDRSNGVWVGVPFANMRLQ